MMERQGGSAFALNHLFAMLDEHLNALPLGEGASEAEG